MSENLEKRSVWEIYTPRNIFIEIWSRLRRYRSLIRLSGRTASIKTKKYDGKPARQVGAFYDVYHEKFMEVYGQVIQAFRTKDVKKLLDYQIKSIGLQDGQKVLDAGCGVGAPAIYFAKKADIKIDAITISKKQFENAARNIAGEGLSDRVTVRHGDYHRLGSYFDAATYDVVYFLESFGHSKDKKKLIHAAWEVLKPGGILYIKDLFRRIPLLPRHKKIIDREIKKINAAYCYDIPPLNTVLDHVRKKGFIVAGLKTIDLKLEEFENLAISNEFQELTGIAQIENWGEYIFPVDFFELKCIKPHFDLDKGLDRYFLQNLYYMQVEGRDENLL